jgi:excisionase family DNA binding protein
MEELSTTPARGSTAQLDAAYTGVSDSGTLLTPQQTAALLGMSAATLARKTRAGEITVVRLGYRTLRYSGSDVAEYVGRSRTAAHGSEPMSAPPKSVLEG